MKNRKLMILSIALTLLAVNCVKADDTTPLDFDISGAVADPDDDTTYYVQIPSDSSKTTVTLTATGDDLDASDCTLTCTACDGSIDDPDEDGNPEWDIDYDAGEQSDNGNGELITWDVDSSVSPGGYDFTVNSVSQNFKCPSDDTSDGDNTAEDNNGSQTYTIAAVPTIPITINAFIPQNNLPGPPKYYTVPMGSLAIPASIIESVVFKGDNRLIGSENGSSRTSQRCIVVPCKPLKSTGYSNYAVTTSGTSEYDADSSLDNGNLTQAALNDMVLGDHYLKIATGTTDTSNAKIISSKYVSSTEFKIEFVNYCGDPLVWNFPSRGVGTIGYDITIDFSFDGKKWNYTISGNAKSFPSIEVFLNHNLDAQFPAKDDGIIAIYDLLSPFKPESIDESGSL